MVQKQCFSSIQRPRSSLLVQNQLIRQQSTQPLTSQEDEDGQNFAYLDEVNAKSLETKNFFKTDQLVDIREMFNARVYMGHKEGTLNEYMKPYLFGSRLGHLIIDLDQSVELLKEALNFTAHIAFRNGIILFVNKSATVRVLF